MFTDAQRKALNQLGSNGNSCSFITFTGIEDMIVLYNGELKIVVMNK